MTDICYIQEIFFDYNYVNVNKYKNKLSDNSQKKVKKKDIKNNKLILDNEQFMQIAQKNRINY